MTDYLELAAGEDADALWEATQELTLLPVRREEGTSSELEMGEMSFETLPLQEELQQVQRKLENGRLEMPAMIPMRDAESAAGRWNRPVVRDGAGWTGEQVAAAAAGVRRAQEEDLLLAQRIDQAFQRDSRRYDGGFFLY